MPSNQVEISDRVRHVLSGGAGLNKLLTSPHLIQDFEDSLIYYAPYMKINLGLFSHITKDIEHITLERFYRIFPDERSFGYGTKDDRLSRICTYKIHQNLQWHNRKRKDLEQLITGFIEVLIKKLDGFVQDQSVKEAAKKLLRTCCILGSITPEHFEKIIVSGWDQQQDLLKTQASESVIALELTQSDVYTKRKYLDEITELKKQLKRAHSELNVVEQQRSEEIRRLSDIQVELQQKLVLATELAAQKSSNEQIIRQLENKKAEHLAFFNTIASDYELLRNEVVAFQELQRNHDLLKTQDDILRIQTLKKRNDHKIQKIEELRILLEKAFKEYLNVDNERKNVEQTLLKVVAELESLRHEYNAERYVSFKAQVKESQAKEANISAMHETINKLVEIIFEKEQQLKKIEEKSQQTEILYRLHVENLQMQMHENNGARSNIQHNTERENLHNPASSGEGEQVMQNSSFLTSKNLSPKMEVLQTEDVVDKKQLGKLLEQERKRHIEELSVVQTEKDALERGLNEVKAQHKAVQQEALKSLEEKQQALETEIAKKEKLTLEAEERLRKREEELEQGFAIEKAQLQATYAEGNDQLQKALDQESFKHQHVLEDERKHHAEELNVLKVEKDALKQNLSETQGQLERVRQEALKPLEEKLQQKEKVLQEMVNELQQVRAIENAQKVSLREEAEEKQKLIKDFTTQLEQLRQDFEEKLNSERMNNLEKLRIKEEELKTTMEKLQQVEAAKEQLEKELEETRARLAASGNSNLSVLLNDEQLISKRENMADSNQHLGGEIQELRLKIKGLEKQNKENIEEAGVRVKEYEEQFQEAKKINENLQNDYNDFISKVELKIGSLKNEKKVLGEKCKQLQQEVARYQSVSPVRDVNERFNNEDKENRNGGDAVLLQYNHITKEKKKAVGEGSPLRSIGNGARVTTSA